MKPIRLEDAIEVVICLARSGVLRDKDTENDSVLIDAKKIQEESITVIEDFFTNVIFNGEDNESKPAS